MFENTLNLAAAGPVILFSNHEVVPFNAGTIEVTLWVSGYEGDIIRIIDKNGVLSDTNTIEISGTANFVNEEIDHLVLDRPYQSVKFTRTSTGDTWAIEYESNFSPSTDLENESPGGKVPSPGLMADKRVLMGTGWEASTYDLLDDLEPTGVNANNVNSMVCHNGLFLVSYSGGGFEWSPDGTNWTTSVAPDNFDSMVWAECISRFVCATPDGDIYTTADGTAFTLTATETDFNQLAASSYNIMVLRDNASVAPKTSTDAITWSDAATTDPDPGTTYRGLGCTPDDRYYAYSLVGDLRITSDDGLTWTGNNSGNGQVGWIAYGQGAFIQIATTTGNPFPAMISTDDGLTWNNITNLPWNRGLGAVIHTGDCFIVASNDFASEDCFAYTYDLGVTWHTASTQKFSTAWSMGCYGHGSQYSLFGNGGTPRLGLFSTEPPDGVINDGVFEGATALSNGKKGVVPKPEAGEQNTFLKGDGTWDTPGGGIVWETITAGTNKDIGNNKGYFLNYRDHAGSTTFNIDVDAAVLEDGDKCMIDTTRVITGNVQLQFTNVSGTFYFNGITQTVALNMILPLGRVYLLRHHATYYTLSDVGGAVDPFINKGHDSTNVFIADKLVLAPSPVDAAYGFNLSGLIVPLEHGFVIEDKQNITAAYPVTITVADMGGTVNGSVETTVVYDSGIGAINFYRDSTNDLIVDYAY